MSAQLLSRPRLPLVLSLRCYGKSQASIAYYVITLLCHIHLNESFACYVVSARCYGMNVQIISRLLCYYAQRSTLSLCHSFFVKESFFFVKESFAYKLLRCYATLSML